MQEIYVNTADALTSLVESLADSEWLALDTEFIREKTYYPRLCLLQISNGEIAACVDPLEIKDLSPLLDLLYNGRILKIFHAARQDLEIFLHDWNQLPLPLFDTQPSAALLGYGDQIGYAKLVKQALKVELPKDQSRTDWSRRPLSENQMRYALDDVIYLGQTYLKLRGLLSDKGRLQWLASDFADLANPATYTQAPSTAWLRIKGRQHLRGVQTAILQTLAAWREEQAVIRDLPRKWVTKDEVMIDLARRSPGNKAQLGNIRGMEPGHIKRDGETILGLIEEASQRPRDDWPVDPKVHRSLTIRQDALVDLLSATIRIIAYDNQLAPTIIATRKDLEKIVLGDGPETVFKGWRHTLAGNSLAAILTGEQQISIDQDSGLPILTGSADRARHEQHPQHEQHEQHDKMVKTE